ncbi:hypothetical protein BBP40_000381 [Aspergillus hancockii]|nr:hypothetical protein BBP40_000381 [Aspergillus hancockii]
MSGLEIGGLILGIFPLVISAIEGCQKGLVVMKLWDARNYRAEIEAIRLEIEVQATIFRNSYMSLLGAFFDQRSLARILADPEGFQNHSAVIVSHFKIHLGPQWQMYSKVMGKLHNTLTTFKFQIEKNSKIDRENWLLKVTSMLKPIRFSFGIKERKGLLQRIKDDNQVLVTLVGQKVALKDLEQLGSNSQVQESHRQRDQAIKLLDSMATTLGCTDVTGHKHSMGLYLGSLLPQDNKEEWQKYTTGLGSLDLLAWVEGSNENYHQRVDIVVRAGSPSGGQHESLCRTLEKHGSRQEHSGEGDFSNALSPNGLMPNVARHGALTYPIPGRLHRQRRDQSSATENPQVQSCPTPSIKYNLDLLQCRRGEIDMSLYDMISSSRQFTRFPRYFFESDRILLAIMLGASGLCLHKSPWLDSSWSSKDILFETKNMDIDKGALLRPFLKTPIPTSSKSMQPQSSGPSTNVAFGPLHSFRLNNTLESDEQIAWRLELEVCGRAGPIWADIISKCLHCPFQFLPDLDDDEFSRVKLGQFPSLGFGAKLDTYSSNPTTPFLTNAVVPSFFPSSLEARPRSSYQEAGSSQHKCKVPGCPHTSSFNDRQSLLRHFKTVHLSHNPHICPIDVCLRIYEDKDTLDEHILLHHSSAQDS